MPARFRLFDAGDEIGDRYTLIDSEPYAHDHPVGPCRSYLRFNNNPYHPTYGIGMHGKFSAGAWANCCSNRFRHLGKRIKGKDLPNEKTKELVMQFLKAAEAKPHHVKT